jgi:hypothetical protein
VVGATAVQMTKASRLSAQVQVKIIGSDGQNCLFPMICASNAICTGELRLVQFAIGLIVFDISGNNETLPSSSQILIFAVLDVSFVFH